MRSGDDKAVDVDETGVAVAKPQEVGAVVVCVLVEGDHEAVERADPRCVVGLIQHRVQPGGVEEGQLGRVGVVECEDVVDHD